MSHPIIKPFSISDYKWGLQFITPLFLRGARAGIQEGEIKISQTELEIENKRLTLLNKMEASLQKQEVLSSVFLLTKRQEKYIEGRIKLIETTVDQNKEILNYLYIANKLGN